MFASWRSTHLWFSVLIVGLAQWSLIAGRIGGELWTATITAAIVLFGGRKMLEHKNGKPPTP